MIQFLSATDMALMLVCIAGKPRNGGHAGTRHMEGRVVYLVGPVLVTRPLLHWQCLWPVLLNPASMSSPWMHVWGVPVTCVAGFNSVQLGRSGLKHLWGLIRQRLFD